VHSTADTSQLYLPDGIKKIKSKKERKIKIKTDMLRSHVNSLGSPRNEKATAGRICGKKAVFSLE